MSPCLATLLFSGLSELDKEDPGCHDQTDREPEENPTNTIACVSQDVPLKAFADVF
jgi:hypothetical protein